MTRAGTGAAELSRPMTGEERKVILASSLGTIFEWYDFYLYGSLAVYIGATFFSSYPETTRNIFALLAFAAGFLVRPFGALVFGRLGDLVGRKYTFLVTILIMGLSTFLVGVLPGADSVLSIDRSDSLTFSCILACSSWLSSLVRSAIFCCSIIAFCSTAFLACAAALSA